MFATDTQSRLWYLVITQSEEAYQLTRPVPPQVRQDRAEEHFEQ